MGESLFGRAVRVAMGSAVSLIIDVENNSWKHRSEQYKPMAWSYNRLANIKAALKDRPFDVAGLREVFAGLPFLNFLPQKGNVSGNTIAAAIETTIKYQLAQYTVSQLSAIAATGDVEQLDKWRSAIDERGIGNIKAPGGWLTSKQSLDDFIAPGNKTILDVYAQAKAVANSVVSAKWNHLIQTANSMKTISDLYSALPQTGSSKDLQTILQNGLQSFDRVLGDGIIGQNEAASGILDYYVMLKSDVNWLKARHSTTEPRDVQVINGLQNFTSVDAVATTMENSVVDFIHRQTQWMKDGLTHYKDIKSKEAREKTFLIVTAVVSAVAAVGSIGFGFSNWRAVDKQWASQGFLADNLPALFGSATLFINNTTSSIINSWRAAGKPIATEAEINAPANKALVDALNDFDKANLDLKNQIFPDMFAELYKSGLSWDKKYVDVLYAFPRTPANTHAQYFASQDDIDKYLASKPFFDQHNYVAFFWADTEYVDKYQTVSGRGIVGIKKQPYVDALNDASSQVQTHGLMLPYQATGTAENDYLSNPTFGYDGTIDGGDGDDVIEANDANNTLIGGAGDDRLVGGFGDNSLSGGSGFDELIGGDGNETLEGGADDDTLSGGAGDDLIWAVSGNDLVDGGVGNDSVLGFGTGNLSVTGGDGNDYIDLSPNDGNSSVSGDAGNDYILASHHNSSSLSGGDGDDTLYGENGNDSIAGGAGNDLIYGNGYNSYFRDSNDNLAKDSNLLDGGDGNDTIYSAGGNDTILGGSGADWIRASGTGNVTVSGGDDDDYIDLWPNTGNSSASGDAGNDKIVASQFSSSVLSGGNGNDTLYGENGRDTLTGDAGDDVIYGNGEYYNHAYDNLVNNGSDSNWLDGGAGNDKIYGAGGNDTIIGGAGKNTLVGGAGADTFVFKPGDGSSNYIWDLNEQEGDRILISSSKPGKWSWTSQSQVVDGNTVAFWKLSGSSYDGTGGFDNIFIRKDGYVNSFGMSGPNAPPTAWPVFSSNP